MILTMWFSFLGTVLIIIAHRRNASKWRDLTLACDLLEKGSQTSATLTRKECKMETGSGEDGPSKSRWVRYLSFEMKLSDGRAVRVTDRLVHEQGFSCPGVAVPQAEKFGSNRTEDV
jgi:hypothetical protein